MSKIELDSIDRRILRELDVNCRTPVGELARLVGKSRQAVEYRIKRLIEKGVIRDFITSFNPTRMGYRLHKIHLRLRHDPEQKAELRKFIASLGNVYWLGESSGNWGFLIGVFYRKEQELFDLTNQLLTRFGQLIAEASSYVTVEIVQYPKNFLTGDVSEGKEYAGEVVDTKLSDLDYRVLKELARNARIPISELALRLGCSPITAKNRMRNLEQKGVIVQYRIDIDRELLDYEFYKTIVWINSYTAEDEKRFRKYVSNIPNIAYFLHDIWQIEMEIFARNFQEYTEILDALKRKFPQVIDSVDTVTLLSDEWTPGYENLFRRRDSDTPDKERAA